MRGNRRNTPRQFSQAPKNYRRNANHTSTPKVERNNASCVLYPDSVELHFRNLINRNCNAKTFDENFYKLHQIMKATFQNGKPVKTTDLNHFNIYGHTITPSITIASNSFDAESWANLFFRCIPDMPLPAYSKEWSVPILWVFDNIQTAIDGMTRSKWIKETRTFDKDAGEMERSHEKYERDVTCDKAKRASINELLKDLIEHNQFDEIPSVATQLTIPTFINKEHAYGFFSIRFAWTLITMHANHINFGEELNRFTILINPSKEHTVQEYFDGMKALRTQTSMHTRYGEDVCALLAMLIQFNYEYHHSVQENTKKNRCMLASQYIDAIVEYLRSIDPSTVKRHYAVSKIERTLSLLKNRYTDITKDEVTLLLQTYPTDVLERYLLDRFVSDYDTSFKLFILMYKLFDVNAIRKAITGGFAARPINLRVRQLAYAIVLGIFDIEVLYDDTYLNAEERIDSLILAVQSGPVDIGKHILQKMETIIVTLNGTLTTDRKFLLKDCYVKVGLTYPA